MHLSHSHFLVRVSARQLSDQGVSALEGAHDPLHSPDYWGLFGDRAQESTLSSTAPPTEKRHEKDAANIENL